MSQKNARLTLQLRLTLAFVAVGIVMALLVTIGMYAGTQYYLRQELNTRLQDVAALAALRIDRATHAAIQSAEQPERLALQQELRVFRSTVTDVRYIYTMRKNAAGQIYFVIDAGEGTGDEAEYGELYLETSPVLLAQFDTMTGPVVETDYYTDRWGTWLSGYAPIFDANGAHQGVVGVDISASVVRSRQWQVLGVAGIILLVTLPLIGWAGRLLGQRLVAPLDELLAGVQKITAGDLDYRITLYSADEVGLLAQAFNRMAERLSRMVQSLEERVLRRTQELERRASYLEAAGQVSRVAASLLEVEDVLNVVVRLISERFGFYHAGIFLVDESGARVVLRAVSSEGGRAMLARGHSLRLGAGIVGYVAQAGRSRTAFDVSEDQVWVQNPDLPETRSEMALPLVVRERVIGVLDVQSVEAEAFGAEDIATLRILADQVAVAIENARLFQESQRNLENLRRTYGLEVQQAWRRRMEQVLGYHYTPTSVEPVMGDPTLSTDTATLAGNVLAVPLRMGETVLGMIRLRREATYPWTPQEINFVRRAVVEIAQSLENIRLLEDARRRATQETVIGEVAGQLRASLDPDVIMKTTVRELGRILGVQRAAIEMAALGEESEL